MEAAGTVLGEWPHLHFTTHDTIALVYTVDDRRCGGFVAYTYALRHLPVSFVSLYAYINPVIAVALGVLCFVSPLIRGWRLRQPSSLRESPWSAGREGPISDSGGGAELSRGTLNLGPRTSTISWDVRGRRSNAIPSPPRPLDEMWSRAPVARGARWEPVGTPAARGDSGWLRRSPSRLAGGF